MDEEIEIAITATCLCGAGVALQPSGDNTYSGKCPLCSREYDCAAEPAVLKEDS